MARISLIVHRGNLPKCAEGKICAYHIFCLRCQLSPKRDILQRVTGEELCATQFQFKRVHFKHDQLSSPLLLYAYALRKILRKVRERGEIWKVIANTRPF